MTMRIGVSAVDLRTGRRVDEHAADEFVSASLIKLPIMLCVLGRVDDGRLRLTDQLDIHDDHRVGGSGWLSARTDVTRSDVRTLVTAMIDTSDNCATNVLLERIGFDAVNATCAELGLRHTVLRRVMMDAAARAAGRENVTSAVDMTTLLVALARGVLLTAPSRRVALDALLGQTSHGRLDRALPAGYRLAHKTGELDGIRHDAGIVLDDDGPRIALSVLTDGEADEARADTAVGAAAQKVYATFGL